MPTVDVDWFEKTARENFELAFLPATNRPNLRYLQIGVFTGDASVWLLENVLTHETSQLYDVDTWDGGGSWELRGIDFAEVERVYDARTEKWRGIHGTNQLFKIKCLSREWFANRTLSHADPYDFIYIDGDHSTVGTLEDAVSAYPLLKVGGLLAFDDYTWRSKHGMFSEPWPAIDAFKMLYADRMRVLRVGSQCWMVKDR